MKLVLAIFIALAMAAPALAFNAEWHGDFNHRASYSTQGDWSKRTSKDNKSYFGIDGYTNADSVPSPKKNKDDADMFAEVKYRTHLVVSDDEKKVKAVLGLEIGSEKFGSGAAVNGGDKTGEIELRWAYTDIQLPFDPASRVSVGLQPVGYNMLLWSDNAAGVKWTRAEGAWKYSLGWWRTDWDDINSGAGNSDSSENGEIYSADATYKFDNGAVNAFAHFRNQGDDQFVGRTYLADGTVDDPGVTVTRDSTLWLGLSGNASWGDLSAMGTAIYQTGEVKTDSATDDLDRQSYLLHAQADYKVDKTTYTLGGLFTPGDDNDSDGDLDNFDHIDISTSVLGSVIIFDNYADDNSFSQATYVFDKGYKIIYGGVAHKLNAKTKVWGKYFWHNTEEDIAGEDEIGHEFVAGVSYTIMKGLTADINAGYLIAGDLLDELVTGDDADDIFRTDARLRFKF
ncbi:histidine kinase [Syntrophotalea acetylenivorans]|nr:histidine kinase [Syntrophotalea acetylenivorans]